MTYNLDPKRRALYPGWLQTQSKWDLVRIGPPGEVARPPARDTKWGSITMVVWAIHPYPNSPPRLKTDPRSTSCRSGWTGNGEPAWPVDGPNGDRVIVAWAATQAAARRLACEQAAVGMVRR